ncbi:hypothetical protein [Novilysobacter arseniciresistens]|uniref:hypothetical protein n=1 Tax=Novilysobacter arseniciresistens TaxID=1385522 RepID=UPI00126A7918|nr:hypothetical protein [Lysobacter arseniciresistens]
MIGSLASVPILLAVLLAPAQPLLTPTPDELQGEAWLIKHGIFTSQWKDPACKALALDLADETKMTVERLASARSLAENAGVVEGCSTDQVRGEAKPETPGIKPVVPKQAINELDNRLLRLEVNEAEWTDEVCQAAAVELANIPQGEASPDRMEAAYALIDRASTVRNCRVAGDHLEADVGAFSDAPNACTSTLYLYPTQSPFVKRLCPLGGSGE